MSSSLLRDPIPNQIDLDEELARNLQAVYDAETSLNNMQFVNDNITSISNSGNHSVNNNSNSVSEGIHRPDGSIPIDVANVESQSSNILHNEDSSSMSNNRRGRSSRLRCFTSVASIIYRLNNSIILNCAMIPLFCCLCVVIGLTWNSECDVPLKWWLLSWGICEMAGFQISKYQYDHPSTSGLAVYLMRMMMIVSRFILLVMGITLLIMSRTCPETASLLYRFSLAVVIIQISTICIAVLCVAMAIILATSLLSNGERHNSNPSVVELASRPRGASDLEISNLDTVIYDKNLSVPDSNGNSEPGCSICNELFIPGEILRFLPCSHLYHISCVDKWLRLSNTCPLCRRTIDSTDISVDVVSINNPSRPDHYVPSSDRQISNGSHFLLFAPHSES